MSLTGRRLIGFAFVGVLSLTGGRSADAAFIPLNLDPHFNRIDVFESVGRALPQDHSEREDESLNDLLLDFGILDLPVDSSNGMGSSSGNGPASVPPFLLVDRHECSPARVVAYLADQPQLLIPVPFLDGVFRPPRA